ncbi:MAG: RdgB/HAM1 family non-canonical purine NTP pyrophosphatase [Ilumatobacteraceae bacterium]
MLKVVCASANPHKFEEIFGLVNGVIDLVARPIDLAAVDESADTLVGNARLKARAVSAATGLPALADDTGLEVDALHGAPGVHSARYGGVVADDLTNRRKLLKELAGVSAENRTARFRTVALLSWPGGDEILAEGTCEGRIAESERGGRGFGYDSLFIANEGDGRTFAEMTLNEKHRLSHRGRAFRALSKLLLPTA